jgi:hypothetical protein
VKALILFLILAAPVMAQSTDARTAAGCGPGSFKFDVKTVKSDHAIAQPEPGKAIVYVVEAVRQNVACLKCKSTVRIGVDGEWTAAVEHDSYAYFSVDPGEHHLCGDWQYPVKSDIRLAAITLKVERDTVYYVVIDLSYVGPDETRGFIKIKSVDPAQGQALVSTRKLTTLEPKK